MSLYFYLHPCSGEDPRDTPFTKALRNNTLVIRTPAPLNSSVVTFFCRSVMTIGNAGIEMGSLVAIRTRFQNNGGQEAALKGQRHIYYK